MNSSDPFEQQLDDFDAAWNSESVPSIDDYLLAATEANQREMLVELVMIDLEYRWRPTQDSTNLQDAQGGTLPWFPLLRDYQCLYPLLGSYDALPLSLIAEEYRVRTRWGDRPTRDQYLMTYGDREGGIRSCLDNVDAELQLPDFAKTELARQDSAANTPSLLSGKTSREQLQVGDLVDDFRLLNKLGSGAFADVFLAQQRSMHRLVALKVSETFSSEPKVLSVLNHPNIVRVYDERQVQGLSLLYMQYVSGGNLREILDDMKVSKMKEFSGQVFLDAIQNVLETKGEIPSISRIVSPVQDMDWPTTVGWIGVGLASALQHAHEQKVHHRDIKFENVLVTSGGRPMLVDFNLGFGESLADDHGELFGGSLAYMSAEQLEVLLHRRNPKDVGPESDFYSLSIVLWELLTGSRPFDGDADKGENTLQKMLELRQQGADPSALPTKCPGGMRKTVLESLNPSQADNLLDGLTYLRRLQLSLLPEVD